MTSSRLPSLDIVDLFLLRFPYTSAMAAKISVVMLALEHDNGTRVSIDGYELDEDVAEFSVGDNILSLKQYIINEKIRSTRDRSQIRVYTPPPASAAPTDANGRWIPCKPLDKLVDEQHYGYIDLGSRMETSTEAQLKRRLTDISAYHRATNDSGSSKSAKLKRVRHTADNSMCCFLCGKNAAEASQKIEASHVFQKQDVYPSKGLEGLENLDLYKDWEAGQPHWQRPFEMHGYMNLIWLCHDHNVAFDRHKFGLTLVDLHHSVRFISYDCMFDGLVDAANTRLSDTDQAFYDMSYVSKRAIGLRMREAARKGHVVGTALGQTTWKAVVGLSETASVGSEDDGGTSSSATNMVSDI